MRKRVKGPLRGKEGLRTAVEKSSGRRIPTEENDLNLKIIRIGKVSLEPKQRSKSAKTL